jgi:hypothetical protein
MVVVALGPMALLVVSATVAERRSVRDAVHRPAAVHVEDPPSERILPRVTGTGLSSLHAAPSIQGRQQLPVPIDVHQRLEPRRGRDSLALRIADDLGLVVLPKVTVF